MSRRPKVNAKLKAALVPFTKVALPTGEDGEHVWLYVGEAGSENWVRDVEGNSVPSHLILEDFKRARQALGLNAGGER